MHELSIACSILDVVEAKLGGVRPLTAAALTVGALSGVSVEALRFCFVELCKARGFGAPELRIEEPAARASCSGCGAEYDLRTAFEECPECGAFPRSVSGGDELYVKYVEVLEEDDE